MSNYEFNDLYWKKKKNVKVLLKNDGNNIPGHEELFVVTVFWVLRVVKETQGKKMKMNLQG